MYELSLFLDTSATNRMPIGSHQVCCSQTDQESLGKAGEVEREGSGTVHPSREKRRK